MSDLRDLYQDVILDHGKSPRNFRALAGDCRLARGHNPLCGDRVDLYLRLDPAGLIEELTFQGSGCAISTASISMMTQALKGRSAAAARELFERFHDMLTRDAPVDQDGLGKLAVFAGVKDYPNRVKCATLGWHTLKAALDESKDPISTE